jgi:dimethylglycine dehydrogenase
VIVGGGMMGVGLAYHLGLEGWTDTLLIEKAELTSGSTWHAAGQCPSFIGDYNMAKVHHYGNTLYPKLEEMTGQSTGWHGCGGLRFASTPEEVDWFRHVEGISRNIGFNMEIISPEEAMRVNPLLESLDGVLAVAWTTDDGHVDPASCCNAMAKAARDIGVVLERHNRVLGIKQLPGGEWLVSTEKGDVTCEHVVNAGGCYAREIMKWVGGDAPITNMEHQYIVTETMPEFLARDTEIPVMRDPYVTSYYRQEQKGGLIGIYEPNCREAWADRGGYPEWDSESELFEEDLDRAAPWMERWFERMPMFERAGIKRIVNGAIPHTPDNNPLLGPAAGLTNFWMSCGAAIGIAQGAGAGKYLAQWMVHGDAEINMASVDPRRFGPWTSEDYVRDMSFQDYAHMYVLHLPGEERPAGRPVRTSTLYETLKAKGGVHTQAFGWERPKWFSLDGREEQPGFRRNNTHEVVAAECRAVRERVGILDLSSFAKYDVTGPDAEAFLNRVYANNMAKKVGGVALAHILGPTGRIRGESTITRLGEDRFYILSGAAWEIRDYDALTMAKQDGEKVEIANVTDDWGVLVVAGPKSRDTLAALTNASLANEDFRWLSGQEIAIAGIDLRALRVNYVGSLGWELHCPMDRLKDLYDAIWKAGEDHGIADFGVYAVNSMRMEKAYKGLGAELTNEITPVEADIMRFVKLDKDFTGKADVEAAKAKGPWIDIVYCEVDAGDADVHGGEPVMDGDKVIGVTTSGGYGHTVGKSLCFAYVEPGYVEPGASFDIEIIGDRHKATVLAEPAFDPKNEDLRG